MAYHPLKRRKLSCDLDDSGTVDRGELSEDSSLEKASSSISSRPERLVSNGNGSIRNGDGLGGPRSKALTEPYLLTGSPYKSGLLKIQLDELLAEVSADHEECLSDLQTTIQQLQNLIKHIPAREASSVRDAERALRKSSGVEVPFPEPRPGEETKFHFSFIPPTKVEAVKELNHIKSIEARTIELAILIPPELFQEKDYLNYRYFHKRAYYIACIADGIQATAKSTFRLSYEYQDGNLLQPILLVGPGKDSPRDFTRSKCRICISTMTSEDMFPAKRLTPSTSCVRSKLLHHGDAEDISSPTPFYNATLRSETTVLYYRGVLLNISTLCESFLDFCFLGQVWLRQRGFGSSVQSGGFGAWELALTCALLIADAGGRKSMFTRYTSYQLFRTTLQFLGSKDLTTPFLVNGKTVQVPKSGGPILYDCKTNFNVLFKVQTWSYNLLKYEALATVKALNSRQHDYFDATFITRAWEPVLRYDNVVRADISNMQKDVATQITSMDDYCRIHEVLIRGLGDRVKQINFSLPGSQRSALSRREKVSLSTTFLTISVILNPASAERLVDRGPPAEEKEAIADFRKFWGNKAELRRFKDGSIVESLVWSKSLDETIVCQIIRHLFRHHFQSDVQSVDLGLKAAKASLLDNVNLSLGHDALGPLDGAFRSLVEEINQLDGLPLSLRSIVPADRALRYALLRIPSESSTLKVDIVLQFEGSARWPDNVSAIQRTKIAFLIKLKELLEGAVQNTMARVGLENELAPLQNQAFLDIKHHTGICFRLRIHHDREEFLLSRDLKSKDLSTLSRETASQALLAYRRGFVYCPTHTQSIRSLCIRYASLPPAIRLLKKWISSHLLTAFLPAPLIELFASTPFVNPYPWATPCNPLTAFLRTLTLLSKWSWPSDPLIVDLDSSLTTQNLEAIHTNFTAWRKLDPDMNTVSLFVASSIDHSGVAWTQHANPPKVVAARLSSLATAAVEVIRSHGLDLDVGRLFKTPTEDYDFLIHLHPQFTREGAAMAGRKKASANTYKNLQTGRSAPKFDLAEVIELFIADAKRILGDHALLFHGQDGESVIAGLWNPRSLTRRPWRVRMGFSAKVVDGGEEQVFMNTEAILAEVGLVGEGIVKKIEVLEKKE